jgi:hypothetical protein
MRAEDLSVRIEPEVAPHVALGTRRSARAVPELPGEEISSPTSTRRWSHASASLPARLVDLIWNREIDPGKVFDLALPLDQVADHFSDQLLKNLKVLDSSPH